MQSSNMINDFLESVSQLSLDDQLMISQIIQKRVIEEKRKELANTVKESREEYHSNQTGKGTIADLLKEMDDEK